MKVLIGTTNPGKAREIKEVFGKDFACAALTDFPRPPEVAESGKTFEENAKIKARAYYEWVNIPAISDDGGLEVDALGGEPGVLSRRWASPEEAAAGNHGREKGDQELIDLALQKLKGVPWGKRTACLKTVVAYYDGARMFAASRGIQGYIIQKQEKPCEPGFPFRAIFWIPQFGKPYQDLTPEEHETVNHRKFALEELRRAIQSPRYAVQ
jgi:XTP/dITP diphosphohydrolase